MAQYFHGFQVHLAIIFANGWDFLNILDSIYAIQLAKQKLSHDAKKKQNP